MDWQTKEYLDDEFGAIRDELDSIKEKLGIVTDDVDDSDVTDSDSEEDLTDDEVEELKVKPVQKPKVVEKVVEEVEENYEEFV